MSLDFPFPAPPDAARPLQVAPGVFWLRFALPFKLDHINLWLIADHGRWVIVDTGYADEASRQAWREIIAGFGPVGRIIVTHFHPDHLGLADWLMAETGAPLAMTTGEFLTAHAVYNEFGGHGARFMVEQFRRHGLAGERLTKYETRGSGYRQSMPALPQHYQRLRGGDELPIGEHLWRVVPGYGHSPEHAGLHCADLGVFISGDMLLPRISTNISVMAATPEADALGAYLDSLNGYARELPASTLVLPSHGVPFVGIPARVAALAAHHQERLQAIVDACAGASHSAAELLPVLFGRELDAHQTMFAMGEAIAHLNYLEQRGRLLRSPDRNGVYRYTRAEPA